MPRTTNKAEISQRMTWAALRLVDALERHPEFKVAWDRFGNKPYQESRRQLVRALVDFGREIVRAVLVTESGRCRRSRVRPVPVPAVDIAQPARHEYLSLTSAAPGHTIGCMAKRALRSFSWPIGFLAVVCVAAYACDREPLPADSADLLWDPGDLGVFPCGQSRCLFGQICGYKELNRDEICTYNGDCPLGTISGLPCGNKAWFCNSIRDGQCLPIPVACHDHRTCDCLDALCSEVNAGECRGADPFPGPTYCKMR